MWTGSPGFGSRELLCRTKSITGRAPRVLPPGPRTLNRVSSASPRRPRRIRAVASAALAAGLLVALPALSGCALFEGPTPETPVRTTPAPPKEAPKLVAGGTAEQNEPFFTEVMRTFSTGKEAVLGEPVVQAVAKAGFDKKAMQVSFDKTKTDLLADYIYVSVRIGQGCLIGQISTTDRSFSVDQVAAIGPNTDICLIGKTRPIDF